jgi:hypothetical protein
MKSGEVVQSISNFVKDNSDRNPDKTMKYEVGLEMISKVKNNVCNIRILENWNSVQSAKFEDDTNRRGILRAVVTESARGTEIKVKGESELKMKVFLGFWYTLVITFIIAYFSNTLTVEGAPESGSGWMLFFFLLLFTLLPYFIVYRAMIFRQNRAQYYIDRLKKEVFHIS